MRRPWIALLCAAGHAFAASAGLYSNSSRVVGPTSTVDTPQTPSANISLTDPLPNLWYEDCGDTGQPPCWAYCHSNDSVCRDAGEQVIATCGPLWSAYFQERDSFTDSSLPSGWGISTSYYTVGELTTLTTEIYTSFTTASDVLTVYPPGQIDKLTITPVYALPPAITSLVETHEGSLSTASVYWTTGPRPKCRYETAVYKQQSDCGQCSIGGNSIQLFFWPPEPTAISSNQSTSANATQSGASAQPTITKSAILPNGMTLYSPTAYISLDTVSASDSCTPVGKKYSSLLIGIDPTLLSTQYHFGGKVAASGANSYASLNLADLTGLPPVSQYEVQPSCLYYGCSTIYPDYHPTLVVPPQLASLDPAWANCGAALNGLYDPPSALTAATAAASATDPWHSSTAGQTAGPGPSSSLAALQCMTPIPPTPTATATPAWNGPSDSPKTGSQISGTQSGAVQSGSYQYSNDQSSSDVSSQPATAVLASIIAGPGSANNGDSLAPSPTPSIPHSDGQNTQTTAGLGSYIIMGISASSTQDSASFVYDPTSSDGLSQQSTVSDHNSVASASFQYEPTSTAASSQQYDAIHNPIVSLDSNDNYVIDSQTLLPGSSITLSESVSSLTVHMITTHGTTFIALGTSTTVPLETSKTTAVADNPGAVTRIGTGEYEAGSVTFSGEDRGDLVLGTLTLMPGSQITVGPSSARTTIALTSINGSEVMIINGKTTEALRSLVISSSGGQSSTTAGSISAASATFTHSSSSTARHGGARSNDVPALVSLLGASIMPLIAWLL